MNDVDSVDSHGAALLGHTVTVELTLQTVEALGLVERGRVVATCRTVKVVSEPV